MSNKECSHSDCEIKTFSGTDKCIFHCKKDDWYEEVNDKKIWNKKLVAKFWEEFKEHKPTIAINQTIFSEYIFPTFKRNMSTNGVLFDVIGFYSFLDNRYVKKLLSLTFSKCKFLGDGEIINIEKETNITLDFNEVIFKDIFKLNLHINKLSFNNCKFENEFHIINSNIKILKFLKTNHLKDSKLYIKKINANKFEIDDIDLSRSSDFIFQISNLTINKELNIKETNLGYLEINDLDISNATILFKNITLNNTKWGNISKIEADRDTFRQLKVANDSQGNYIVANRFFSMEMREYKKELKEKSWFSSDWQDKLIFLLNKIVSNFGQSWFLPLVWFFIISCIFYFPFSTYICGYAYIDFSLQSFAQFINLLSKRADIKYETFYHFWLIHKIISSFITYHFIIALKRQTRR